MKVSTSIVNSQICLKDIELEFESCGIYVISGENGSGKTSLIKKIVFDENNIKFKNSEQELLFNKDRSFVIGYVEQDPVAYDVELYKYITRYSTNAGKSEINRYMEMFDLKSLKMNKNICKLSGGELTKVNILATLLQDTAYVFMDEPTNNLDNDGVRRFVNIVSEYAKNHTVIIISHDPRMVFDEVTEYLIENNCVTKIREQKKSSENVVKSYKKKFPLKNIINNYIFSFSGVASTIVTLIAISLFCLVNAAVYYSTVVTENEIEEKNIIIGYKVDEVYGELNKIYTKSENITVDEKKNYQMIYFSDLINLLQNNMIQDIIIPDIGYIDKLNEKIVEYADENNSIDELLIYAAPERILKNFHGQITLPVNTLMLKEGRLPKDNCDEVTISERLAKEYFKINYDQNSEIIGRKILINKREYKIVGIGYADIALLSYEEGMVYGNFSLKNNKDKLKELGEYLVENDYYLSNGSTDEIIITKKGKEKEVLDYLIKNYPAENYSSYEFEKVFNNVTNKKADKILLIVNIIGIIVINIIIIAINFARIKINRRKALSIDNFYCKKHYLLNIYRILNCCQYGLLTTVVAIGLVLYGGEVFKYCYIFLLISIMFQFVQFVGKRNEYY